MNHALRCTPLKDTASKNRWIITCGPVRVVNLHLNFPILEDASLGVTRIPAHLECVEVFVVMGQILRIEGWHGQCGALLVPHKELAVGQGIGAGFSNSNLVVTICKQICHPALPQVSVVQHALRFILTARSCPLKKAIRRESRGPWQELRLKLPGHKLAVLWITCPPIRIEAKRLKACAEERRRRNGGDWPGPNSRRRSVGI
mmetsp:Transcript_49639/g.116706  ORF Transcript_49639/g.116706 Transcript_49639/m.116706 type:complete len:202 (+) Transcript_49639:501-1106(+)